MYFKHDYCKFFSFPVSLQKSDQLLVGLTSKKPSKLTLGARGKQRQRKRLRKLKKYPRRKKKEAGKTIEEPYDELDGLNSTLGESIYEDFDDPKYY